MCLLLIGWNKERKVSSFEFLVSSFRSKVHGAPEGTKEAAQSQG